MARAPLTIVIWLVAAVLVVLVGMRVLGGGGSGGGGEPIRFDGGGADSASAAARGGASSGSAMCSGDSTGGGDAPSSCGDGGAVVHVAGAVRRPGLYRIDASARVAAAVERAGGPSRRADLNAINLAATVQDGQQVMVPARAAGGAAAGVDAKPSLGNATQEQLEELDGIGPALAERIVEYRTEHGGFRSIDELSEVDGIGEQRLAALEDSLTP